MTLLLFSLPSYAKNPINPPKGFEKKVYDATFVLYAQKDGELGGACTATAFEKTSDGYNLVTAGHCFYEVSEGMSFSVAHQIGEADIPATVIKAHLDDELDMMVLHIKTKENIPVIPLDTKSDNNVGDKLLLVTFGDMLGKQISTTTLSTSYIIDDICDGCAGKFALPIPQARGASGSAVISLKTHKIIGILVLSSQFNSFVQPIADFNKLVGIEERKPETPDDIIKKLLEELHN